MRQFLAPGFEGERAQLAALAEWMRDRTHLVTFNGRTFDLPLLEMRFSFNRLAWPWHHLPHLDALHPARRFWREPAATAGPAAAADESSCSLGVLEKRLSGLHRVGDVPGFEIPARFFQFARDGRAEPLEAVLEHNRIDLLSTLLVLARASMLVVGGPAAAERGRECLGLGRIYERLGRSGRGGGLLCPGGRPGRRPRRPGPARRSPAAAGAVATPRRPAWRRRRSSWEALLATRGAPAHLRREAREALAIHHEHRAGDLDAARTLVLDALAEPLADRHRIERPATSGAARTQADQAGARRPHARLRRRTVLIVQRVGSITASCDGHLVRRFSAAPHLR